MTTSKNATAKSRMTLADVRRFRQEEEGGMIIFSLFMLVLILFLAGTAVDLMRFETTRAKLQNTLDRATLAAADLDQTLPPADVVRDYFAKAGMAQFLQGDPIVDEGLNYRVVTANAQAEMPMFFVDMPRVFMQPFSPGLSTMNVSGNSTAEERVTDVEISLVLDVSGSMGSNNRIQNLRPAAREFVTTVMANNTNAPQGLITVSMVPYSAVVNTGNAVAPFLTNLNRTHEYSTCPLFDDALFNSTALSLAGNYDHVSHFDPDWIPADTSPIADPWCHTDDHNAIFPVSTDEGELHSAINDLEPYGNTAIDMGVKWGVALLDPSTRSMITSLAGSAAAHVPAIAQGRPEDLGQSDVLKIVVLMTDGSNTQQYDLIEPYKSGLSYVWFDLDNANQDVWDVDSDEFSVQIAGVETPDNYYDDRFYWNFFPSSTRIQDHPNGYDSQTEYVQARQAGGIRRNLGHGATFADNVHMASWQELYAGWEHNRVNNELLLRAYSHGAIPWSAAPGLPDYRDADFALDRGIVNNGEADDRLSDICAAARAEGIIIYTIAFEAPAGGQAALQDCATLGNYYNVSGTDISDAFSTIASNIRNLKLTR